MCVSASPAEFSGTTVLINQIGDPEYGVVHVLGYQNTAESLGDGPNAMLLHLPARGVLDHRNVVDTRACPDILADMVRAVQREEGGGMRFRPTRGVTQAIVFEHGIYTVVLGRAEAIAEALRNVPSRKRPRINRALFAFYAQQFPEWTIALCCFDNRDAKTATPLLWWYPPLHPHRFHLPAIDCHTGGVPNLDAEVEVDHWVIVGTDRWPERGARVAYRDNMPSDIRAFLPNEVVGRRFTGTHPNGDFGGDFRTFAGASDIQRISASASA